MRILLLPKGASSGGANWLVTLADLIALMVCFFVMMFAMSSLDVGRWEAVSRGMRSAMPAPDDKHLPQPTADTVAKPLPVAEGLDLGYLDALLSRRIASDGTLAGLDVSAIDGAVVVSLPGALLFGGGEAMLRPEGKRAVRRLAELLANLRNEIAVVGYAALPADRNGWATGIAAASAVAETLVAGGVRSEIRTLSALAVAGSGTREDRPVARVEILVRENGVR